MEFEHLSPINCFKCPFEATETHIIITNYRTKPGQPSTGDRKNCLSYWLLMDASYKLCVNYRVPPGKSFLNSERADKAIQCVEALI